MSVEAQPSSVDDRCTHSAIMASIIVLLGLPMTVGVRLLAYTKGDEIAPEPARISPLLYSISDMTDPGRW
jgi:hypothetical protein